MTKRKVLLVCISLIALIACKPGQIKNSAIPKTGMFKVEILYPNGEGKTFDMEYYEQKHMPMMAGFIGKNLVYYEIDKGISGRTPTDKSPFLAIGYFYINDIAAYNKVIAQNIDTILSDIKKYTNIQPTIQISEIRQLGETNTK